MYSAELHCYEVFIILAWQFAISAHPAFRLFGCGVPRPRHALFVTFAGLGAHNCLYQRILGLVFGVRYLRMSGLNA